jgi:arylsulfatase I/J
MVLLLLLLWLSLGAAAAAPHIVLIIGDDLGWHNAGWNSNTSASTLASATPHLDLLAHRGAVLHRMYGFHYCSPSRSALLSGRLPVHVFDGPPTMPLNVVNPAEPDAGQYGVPASMDTLPRALAATHDAHMVGKWDIGYARPALTPTGRGFLTFFGYLGGQNDYWSSFGCPYRCCAGMKGGGKDPLVLDHFQDGRAASRGITGPSNCTGEVRLGLRHIVALYYSAFTLYHIH